MEICYSCIRLEKFIASTGADFDNMPSRPGEERARPGEDGGVQGCERAKEENTKYQACYRIEKRGNPEIGWGGCWESAAKIPGAEGSAGECAAPIPFQRNPLRSTLAGTPGSTPKFCSTLPSTLRSHCVCTNIAQFSGKFSQEGNPPEKSHPK